MGPEEYRTWIRQNQSGLTPKRVAIFFTGVESNLDVDDDLMDIVSSIVGDAESRGLFFEWAAVGDMDLTDVVQWVAAAPGADRALP